MGEELVEGEAALGRIESRLQGVEIGADGGGVEVSEVGDEGVRESQGFRVLVLQAAEGTKKNGAQPGLP
jgi:hypothetical protein